MSYNIDITKMKNKDLMEFAEACKDAQQRAAQIRYAVNKADNMSLQDELLASLLTPSEMRFAKEHYYIGSPF